MRRFIAPLLAVPLILGAAPVFAQSNPSADQIIQSLKPKGNLTTGSTRGIRLAPAPAGTASQPAPMHMNGMGGSASHMAAAKPAAPMQEAGKAPSVNLNVDFATGSAQLTPQAKTTLDQLGRALSSSQLASYRFRIVGHTDTVGSPALNKTLSEQRAQAVVKYLSEKFGVQQSRLEAEGVGEAGLLVPTPPQTPEPRNRRVQVINLGA